MKRAFEIFIQGEYGADDFMVLRGEIDDFIIFARRVGKVWGIAAICKDSGSLTVRFEDVWLKTPPEMQALNYSVSVFPSPDAQQVSALSTSCQAKPQPTPDSSMPTQSQPASGCATLLDVAPDARIFLDHAKGGGFVLTFTPQEESLS